MTISDTVATWIMGAAVTILGFATGFVAFAFRAGGKIATVSGTVEEHGRRMGRIEEEIKLAEERAHKRTADLGGEFRDYREKAAGELKEVERRVMGSLEQVHHTQDRTNTKIDGMASKMDDKFDALTAHLLNVRKPRDG